MSEKRPRRSCVSFLEGSSPCLDCMDYKEEASYWLDCYIGNHQNPNDCPTYYNGCNCGGAMAEEISLLKKKLLLLEEAAEGFVEVSQAAINSKRQKGGQQVPYHGDFASIPPSTIRDLEYWQKRFNLALNGSKIKCQCQWEAGDSPCSVHGEDSQ